MGLPLTVQAGRQRLALGAQGIMRGGMSAEGIFSEYLPPYAQAGLDGDMYSVASQAAQATSLALATAYTGLALYNPVGSGVILIPLSVKVALAAAPAAIAPIALLSALQTADPTGTTELTPVNSRLGDTSRGKGRAFTIATITTPIYRKWLHDGFTAAALPSPQAPIDLKGEIQILPGGVLAIGSLTVISMLGSFTWVEVPIANITV